MSGLRGGVASNRDSASKPTGAILEVHAIRRALSELNCLPQGCYMSLNASPDVILSEALHATLSEVPCENLLLEVTEHTEVADYDAFQRRLEPLRIRGLQVAVDDAGAGFASLNHIVKLRPDVIKLDLSLTKGIDTNANQRAIASALAGYSKEIGVRMIAEGIETAEELETLRRIGIGYGQGYLLGRPQPLPVCARQTG